MSREETKTFVAQSAVLVVANLIASVLSAVYVSLTGRMLGPKEYGALTAGLSLSYLFGLLLGPIETTVTRLAARYHAENAHSELGTLAFSALAHLTRILLLGLVLWAVAAPIARWSLQLEDWSEILVIAVYCMAALVACVPRGVQRGAQRFVGYGANQVTESLVRLLAGTVAISAGLGAAGAAGGYAAGALATVALGFWQLRDLRKDAGAPVDWRELASFSLPVTVVYAYFLILTNVDMLAAKHYLSEVDAGMYGACSTLSRLTYLVASPIYQLLFSRVAEMKTRRRSSRGLSLLVGGTLAIGLIAGYAMVRLFGDRILVLVFGPAFAGGAAVLGTLWITTSILILQSVCAFALLGANRLAGVWLLLVPCAGMMGMLWRRHADMQQVAWSALLAGGAGTLVFAAMLIAAARSPRR